MALARGISISLDKLSANALSPKPVPQIEIRRPAIFSHSYSNEWIDSSFRTELLHAAFLQKIFIEKHGNFRINGESDISRSGAGRDVPVEKQVLAVQPQLRLAYLGIQPSTFQVSHDL